LKAVGWDSVFGVETRAYAGFAYFVDPRCASGGIPHHDVVSLRGILFFPLLVAVDAFFFNDVSFVHDMGKRSVRSTLFTAIFIGRMGLVGNYFRKPVPVFPFRGKKTPRFSIRVIDLEQGSFLPISINCLITPVPTRRPSKKKAMGKGGEF